MTPEQIELARKHKILPLHDSEFPEYFAVNEADLAAYTAAVEAKRDEEVAELTRKLAERHLIIVRLSEAWVSYGNDPISYNDATKELAALLAKERERCVKLHDHEDVLAPIGNSSYGESYQDGWIAGTSAYQDAIGSLNE